VSRRRGRDINSISGKEAEELAREALATADRKLATPARKLAIEAEPIGPEG